MAYQTVLYEKEEELGIVTLNRPEKLNALSAQLMEEMNKVIDDIAADDNMRVLLITGSGRAFCAGADIEDVLAGKLDSFQSRQKVFMHRLEEELEKPVIAAVNGIATGGGCEIVLASDLCLASNQAQFGFAEIKIGIIPGAGGTQRLPRRVGITKAKELLYTGDPISAEEAYRIGLINMVVPADSLMNEAKELARRLASRPPLAIKMLKSCVNVGMQVDLSSALDYESRILKILRDSEDRVEGMRAFMEKRKPVFKGR